MDLIIFGIYNNLWNIQHYVYNKNKIFYQIKVIKMMKNYDQSVEINHNPNRPYIPDHIFRILIIGGSGSAKTNVLLNLIKIKDQILIKIFLYIKGAFKSKYQLLINRKVKVGIENPKASIHYSQKIDDVGENLENYNPTMKRRVLIVFNYMIADMVTELFLRGKSFRFFYIAILLQSA